MNKILIINELSTLSKVYVDLLLKDYEVEAGTNPQEIIPRAHRLRPDLVIVNSDLHGFDPHEFCQNFKANFQIPVLLLLEPKSPATLQIDGCSADEVISKPFAKDVFFEAVKRLLN